MQWTRIASKWVLSNSLYQVPLQLDKVVVIVVVSLECIIVTTAINHWQEREKPRSTTSTKHDFALGPLELDLTKCDQIFSRACGS